jgi:hypothetical protein
MKFLVNPPLLPGEVEIDVSDCFDPDELATARGDAANDAARLRIEAMIADRKRKLGLT